MTAVFLGLSGLGERPCEVSDLFAAQRAVLAVHSVATALRGAVLRLITDDKGTRFLIAFGLPGHANEDDESRAVLACLQVALALTLTQALTLTRKLILTLSYT